MVEIISLIDNINDSKKLISSEGNAVIISINGQHLLFDVGRFGAVFNHNIARTEIPEDQISYIVLSHGHEGHVGAFAEMELPKQATIFAGAGIFCDKLKTSTLATFSFRHLWESRRLPGDRLSIVEDHTKLFGGRLVVFRTPELQHPIKWNEKHHILLPNAQSRLDDFSEELSLCIITPAGLIVVLACAHRGIDNIVDRAVELTGEKKVLMILGGTHIREDPCALDRLSAAVEKHNVKYIAPSHCTGITGICQLYQQYAGKIIPFHTGIRLMIDSAGTVHSGRI